MAQLSITAVTAIPDPSPTPIPIVACFPSPTEPVVAAALSSKVTADEVEGGLSVGDDHSTVEARVFIDVDGIESPLLGSIGAPISVLELEMEVCSTTLVTDVELDEAIDVCDSEVAAFDLLFGSCIQNSAETKPPFLWPSWSPCASTARINHGTSQSVPQDTVHSK